jgi:hypothetical protein
MLVSTGKMRLQNEPAFTRHTESTPAVIRVLTHLWVKEKLP